MRNTPSKETLKIEFKSDLKRYPDKKLYEDVAALANTYGGYLYLGVEDNGEVTCFFRSKQKRLSKEMRTGQFFQRFGLL